MGAIYFGQAAKLIHERVGAGHGTAQGAANPKMVFAGGGAPKHGVESHEFEDIDWFEAELGGDPLHPLIADQPEMFLPEVEQGKRSTAFLIGRIMADRLIHLGFELGWNFHPSFGIVCAFHNDCAGKLRKHSINQRRPGGRASAPRWPARGSPFAQSRSVLSFDETSSLKKTIVTDSFPC